ncbi:hypothetical protein IB394_004610 [Escherichia coli]|nr:hypothetical protein [Escherichia coli]EFI5593307.1 hypothetical protein [Escherichia coli]EFI6095005.1 hypothetical protein [Escherichia coli]EFI8984233.1 hypothetical protein [Escherichia coli]EFI9568597.1 hypothetical protein [Escherichia coli]
MKKFTPDTLNKTAEKYRDMQSQSPSDRKICEIKEKGVSRYEKSGVLLYR